MDGSLSKTEAHSVAMYAAPDDLVEVALGPFMSPDYRHLAIDRKKILRGRLVGKQIQPYYSHAQIDGDLALAGRNLELCYLDPVDAYMIHVQGSGTVKLADGSYLILGYVGQNGRRYVPMDETLAEKFPASDWDSESIYSFLRKLPRDQLMPVLFDNPSYIFFRKLDTRPITTMGTEVVDGRTIATDSNYFPKGTLAFLRFTSFDPQSNRQIATGRLVIDSDTGGTIKGTAAVDLFSGRGDVGWQEINRLGGKQQAALYYLVPK